MTTYLTEITDPNDTGEIRIGDLEQTRNLGPAIIAALTRISPNLRSADATEVIPIVEEPLFTQFSSAVYGTATDPSLTGEVLDLDTGGYPKPKPLPKPKLRHAIPARTRQDGDPGRHRAAPPRWMRWSVRLGWLLVGAASGTLAVLAVIR